jgi:tetratricopeptide (TPR) repeat protein
VLALSPDNYFALNNMTALQTRKKNNPQILKEALVLAAPLKGSGVAAFLDTYGWLSYLNGKYDESLVALEEATSLEDSIPEIHYHLGMVYSRKGRIEEAKLSLQKAVANNAKYFGINEAKKELKHLTKS